MGTYKVRTRYGVFAIDEVCDRKMAEAFENSEFPNEMLLEVARAFVNKKSIVVDIGAHIGTFSIPIASEVEKVVAFEPSSETFSLLSRNAEENNVPVYTINKALGSKKGSGALVTRSASNAGANTLVSGNDIPVATLDDEVTHADFIKIDVEGMELDVLRGGERLIKRSRPVVLFEVNLSQLRSHGASPRALGKFFAKRGYRLYFTFLRNGNLIFACARSITLLTVLIAPRAWLFFGDSAPFDIVAVPKEQPRSFQYVGFMTVISRVIRYNIAIKYKRLNAFFHSIF